MSALLALLLTLATPDHPAPTLERESPSFVDSAGYSVTSGGQLWMTSVRRVDAGWEVTWYPPHGGGCTCVGLLTRDGPAHFSCRWWPAGNLPACYPNEIHYRYLPSPPRLVGGDETIYLSVENR